MRFGGRSQVVVNPHRTGVAVERQQHDQQQRDRYAAGLSDQFAPGDWSQDRFLYDEANAFPIKV
ncbi:MAG: hypothetical protein EA420_16890 [Candidatus Competibacteraceae bacterium]|jgi:hypothetical protein|nr:MAG: hypothetical protein EA420_16890 [Candidatus Competibacteraceae bacterium]